MRPANFNKFIEKNDDCVKSPDLGHVNSTLRYYLELSFAWCLTWEWWVTVDFFSSVTSQWLPWVDGTGMMTWNKTSVIWMVISWVLTNCTHSIPILMVQSFVQSFEHTFWPLFHCNDGSTVRDGIEMLDGQYWLKKFIARGPFNCSWVLLAWLNISQVQ